jgi:hypothetical protein
MQPVPTDFARYRRLRWYARLATLLFVLVILRLVVKMVGLAQQGGDAQRSAIVPYVALCVVVVVA